MRVHCQVALTTQMQIHTGMFGKDRQHVVEKGDARFDPCLPASVNVQFDENPSFVGRALHLSLPLFHAYRLNSASGGKQMENTRMRIKWAQPGTRTAPLY